MHDTSTEDLCYDVLQQNLNDMRVEYISRAHSARHLEMGEDKFRYCARRFWSQVD